jgi:SUF system FeS cluster assembly, SufBD
MDIDFKMNPYHFFDSKLLEFKSDFIATYDWEEILAERRKSFPDYSFIITDNDEGLLHTDFLTGWGFNDTDIRIHFDNNMPQKIYWINIQNGEKETHFSFDNDINLIHESLVRKTIKGITHLKFKANAVYTNIIQNDSGGIFHQYLAFKNFKNTSCYFLQKDTDAKNKVNQKHYLSEEKAESNIFVLNKVQTKQLRDDFVEFEHSHSHTKSDIKYFSINGGKAVSQINSFIPKDVVECETHQHIKHILINDKAQSYSKPNLMIKNPNVIASHGNSIGSYNDDELFYLMQRGIDLDKAKKIVQDGIINQALESHPDYELVKGYFNE